MTGIASAFSDSQKTRTPSGTPAGGYSPVKLMVAMAMASVVLAAIYSLHATLVKSYTAQNAAADVQEAMRAGIDLMAEDILPDGTENLYMSSSRNAIETQRELAAKLGMTYWRVRH